MIRSLLGGLRVRLVLLTLLVLFPLGLIALWQTFGVVQETRKLNEQRLMDATRVAATEQRAQIKEAIGAGYGLGAMALESDLETCRAAMARFLRNDPIFAFVGYIPVSGLMACSSAGDRVIDFSDYDTLEDAIDRADVYVEVNADGAVSGQAVVIVSVPVFDAADTLAGFVSLSLPKATVAAQGADLNVTLAAIATSGEVFALRSADTAPAQHLPVNMATADIVARAGETFVARDISGQNRMFAVTEPVADSYVIVGSWAQDTVVGAGVWRLALMPALFAVLMWAASMSVAYFGLDRLVLRHLKSLRSAMRQFALGERSSDGLRLEGAPDEFKDAERAFNRMALLITEAEARQMTDLHDKEVLLREVHHRVKNNLQMIASIMNLQARGARSDEVRDVLSGLQRRVRALAMLHQTLYTEPESARVDARDVVATVVSDASTVLLDASLQIQTELTSALLYPDQAVPLSMWMTEALTNAAKYVGQPEDAKPEIRVTMTLDDSNALCLSIKNTVGAPLAGAPSEGGSSGLGTKLMTAFCRQLDGTVTTEKTGDRFTMVLRFAVQGFAPDGDGTAGDVAA